MTDNNIDVSITGSSTGLESALNTADKSIDKTVTKISSDLGKLSGTFGGVTGKLAAFGGALSAIESVASVVTNAIGKIIGQSLGMADAAGKVSGQLALTTEEWSAYSYGAGLSDIATGQLSASIKRLNSNVVDAANNVGIGAEAFDALGISVKDSEGKLKSNGTLMSEIADKFSKMPDSANKTALALDLFGKSGDKMLTMLNGGSEGLRQFDEEAKRMGVSINQDLAGAAERFNDNMTKMGTAMRGAGLTLVSNLLPSMNRLTDLINSPAFQEKLSAISEGFSAVAGVILDIVVSAFELLITVIDAVMEVISALWDIVVDVADVIASSLETAFGSSSISKVEFFANVLKVIKLAFLGMGYAIEQMANGISSALEITGKLVMTFAVTASRALALDFTGAKEAWRQGMADIDAIVQEGAEKIAKTNEKYSTKANDIIFPTAPQASGTKSSASSDGGDVSTSRTNSKTRTSDWAAELESTKQAYQLQNNLRELDIQKEIEYWNSRLAQASAGSKEYSEIQKKITDAKIRQLQVANQQAADIEAINIERSRAAAMAQLDIDQSQARAMVDIGKMSQDEYVAALVAFEDRRYAIALAGIEARIALAEKDPNSNPATLAKLNAELEAVHQEHMKNKNNIDMEALRESNAVWEQISTSAASLWDKGLTAMMNGTLTWKNAMNAIWAEMGKVFLNFAAQKAKNWLMTEVLQTAYSRVQILARTALERMGLLQSTSATASSAMTKVGANAAVAGSGAASAVASIPYVGPVLAIAAMAAMLASVGALKGGIKSARGGYDIPAGLNPMTQLHEQEMVLPKEQAEAIRNMAGGGGGAGITLNVSAVDAASFRRLVLDNDRAIGDAIRQHIRNGGGRLS